MYIGVHPNTADLCVIRVVATPVRAAIAMTASPKRTRHHKALSALPRRLALTGRSPRKVQQTDEQRTPTKRMVLPKSGGRAATQIWTPLAVPYLCQRRFSTESSITDGEYSAPSLATRPTWGKVATSKEVLCIRVIAAPLQGQSLMQTLI
jgi:hypothetical protein